MSREISVQNTRVVVEADMQATARAAARFVAAALGQAVEARGRASLFLAGGSSPEAMHRVLATLEVPWSCVSIFFGDERAVAPDHAESNYRAAKETLLDHLPTAPAAVHRMHGEADDLDAEAGRYAGLMPTRPDVVVLGMGPDGHTCSLFPGHPLAEERTRSVAAIYDSPKPPPHRLTVTPALLERSEHLVMLVTGGNKAEALRRGLLEGEDLPLRLAARGVFFVDTAAAGDLPEAAHAEKSS